MMLPCPFKYQTKAAAKDNASRELSAYAEHGIIGYIGYAVFFWHKYSNIPLPPHLFIMLLPVKPVNYILILDRLLVS